MNCDQLPLCCLTIPMICLSTMINTTPVSPVSSLTYLCTYITSFPYKSVYRLSNKKHKQVERGHANCDLMMERKNVSVMDGVKPETIHQNPLKRLVVTALTNDSCLSARNLIYLNSTRLSHRQQNANISFTYVSQFSTTTRR